jgi:hypothetical protein
VAGSVPVAAVTAPVSCGAAAVVVVVVGAGVAAQVVVGGVPGAPATSRLLGSAGVVAVGPPAP